MVRINSPGGTTAGSEALYASLRAVAEKKPVVAVHGRGRGLGRLHHRDRRRPYRRARQHADRLDRRDHGVSRPDAGDGPARDRARDRALVRAQGRAVAVPRRPTRRRGRSTRRSSPRATRWFRGLVGERRGLDGPALDRGGERRGLHRAARARERPDRRDRRRARGDRLARIARRGAGGPSGPRLGGRGATAVLDPARGRDRPQPAGFSGKYRFRTGPKLYSIGP